MQSIDSGSGRRGPGPSDDTKLFDGSLAGQDRPVSTRLDAGFLDGAELPDSYLVDQARKGSTDAFEVLVVRYRDRAFRLALRLTGNYATAEDIAQDALVSAWRGLPRFRGDAQFSTWLHRIVVNASMRQSQQRRRWTGLPEDDTDADDSARPDSVVEADHRVQALHRAVLDLPFDLRAPLVLHQFQGCSYDETAAILDISVDTVRGRIFRARRRLVPTMREWR